MGMGQERVRQCAEELRLAERTRNTIETFSTRAGEWQLSDAYAIQFVNVGHRLSQGERLLGYKVGLTSREAQRQFQVFEPDFGHLFDPMQLVEESKIPLAHLIQPRIEGEIAFVLGHDLKGPGVSLVEAIRAVDYVTAAIEIVDTRYQGWKIGAFDTIADNGSSARYALAGKRTSLNQLDLASVGMAFSANGDVVVTGAGAAVMGNPLNALVFLANQLGQHGRGLTAGEVVLSGSLGAMVPIQPNTHYRCEMLGLGVVNLVTAKSGVDHARA